MDITKEKTYTKSELAEMLHVTVMTINNYIKAGKLEAVKLCNRRVLIPESALNDFLRTYQGALIWPQRGHKKTWA